MELTPMVLLVSTAHQHAKPVQTEVAVRDAQETFSTQMVAVSRLAQQEPSKTLLPTLAPPATQHVLLAPHPQQTVHPVHPHLYTTTEPVYLPAHQTTSTLVAHAKPALTAKPALQ